MSLKLERIRRGIKQWEFARELGIDNTKLSMIENGRITPGEEIKKKCSRLLKTPINVLFPKHSCDSAEEELNKGRK